MSWKTTWGFSRQADYSNIEMVETSDWQFTEMDPFADEFALDGETFVQDALPEPLEQTQWEQLDAEALEDAQFDAEVELMYGEEVLEEAEVGLEVAEAIAESVEITAEISAGAIAGSIAGGVVTAALLLGSFFAGKSLLKKYKRSKLPEMADNNFMMGAVGYLVVGKIWLPCYIDNVAEHQKGADVAWAFYYDITHFPRWATVKVDDPTLQIVKPITTDGFWNMTPKMMFDKKLVEVGFFKEIPIGTRVKLTTPPHSSKEKRAPSAAE